MEPDGARWSPMEWSRVAVNVRKKKLETSMDSHGLPALPLAREQQPRVCETETLPCSDMYQTLGVFALVTTSTPSSR